MSVDSSCIYTKEHEWAKVEGNKVKVGISHYAQSELGDIVFIDLPQVGDSFSKGDSFANVESVKAVSDIYAPCNGKVTAINTSLEETPEVMNTDSYSGGWIVEFEIEDESSLSDLLSADDYQSFISELSK